MWLARLTSTCCRPVLWRTPHYSRPHLLTNFPSCAPTLMHLGAFYSKCSDPTDLGEEDIVRARDIKRVETVQRRATRFIVGGRLTGYKERLFHVGLLPLAYWMELQDLMFIIKCLKSPPDNFNIQNYTYVAFSTGCRSSSAGHLQHQLSRTSEVRHFYFTRIFRLWNALSPIDLNLSVSTLKSLLYEHLWNHFSENFNDNRPCTFHFRCPCSNCILTQR